MSTAALHSTEPPPTHSLGQEACSFPARGFRCQRAVALAVLGPQPPRGPLDRQPHTALSAQGRCARRLYPPMKPDSCELRSPPRGLPRGWRGSLRPKARQPTSSNRHAAHWPGVELKEDTPLKNAPASNKHASLIRRVLIIVS